MGGSERTWGSKGRASWKVTLSSRRWVLYPIRLASSCAYLFGFRPSASVTVTLLLFFSRPLGILFAEALATCDLLLDIFHNPPVFDPSAFPPPFFFPWEFEVRGEGGGSFPIKLPLPDVPPLRRHRSIYATTTAAPHYVLRRSLPIPSYFLPIPP